MKNILVYIDKNKNDEITQNSLEAIVAAKQIVDNLSGKIFCIVRNGNAEIFSKVALFEDQTVFNLNHSGEISAKHIANYLSDFILDKMFDIVIFPASVHSNEIAPIVAVKCGAAFISNAMDFNFTENQDILYSQYLYSGKFKTQVRVKTKTQVMTIASNKFVVPKDTVENKYVLEQIQMPEVDDDTYKFIEITSAGNIQSLTDARVIVSVGRGVSSAENIAKIEKFATKISAALGASRAVVDNGWLSHPYQVGQTGKTVTPNVYIACGISGAMQHLAGMSRSKFIIAINIDEKAPIFDVADVSVVGDLFSVIEKLEKYL